MSDAGRGSQRRAVLMSAALFGMGTLHFVAPKPFDSIVPPALPGRARTYTYASGVAEIGVAAALAAPRTRQLGGRLAVLLFLAVFPANIQFAADSVRNPKAAKAIKWVSVLRLPFQVPMITQALRISREAA
ncbi:DoxX family protein [Nocardia nova]